MLKLRKIEVLGFKSFCERTVTTFGSTGVTGIVGPNGCGKSNIVDAISWVLGEQSHKMLRAERMADCIFNGTAKRPPMGLAEVQITLVDPELAEAAAKVLEAQDAAEARPVDTAAEPTEAAADRAEATGQETAPSPEGEALGEAPGDVPEEVPVDAANPAEAGPLRKRRAPRPTPAMKPGEVVVGRRLYRSGQSEYLLNGRSARLRDIQELFMGTGLGPESYAIIEQGRIGQILGARPHERRAIIEEAAGVTKYKTKKRLAEAKLEAAKTNLSRINDIFVEVEKQLASLKRQAAKARRFTELREQLRTRQRIVLASRARALDSEASRLQREFAEACAAEQGQAAQLAALETEHAQRAQQTSELEAELRLVSTHLSECSLELDRAENRLNFQKEQGTQQAAQLETLAGEAEQAAEELAAVEHRALEQAAALSSLREEAARLEAALTAAIEASAAQVTEERHLTERLESLRLSSADLATEQVSWRAEEARAEEALGQFNASVGRLRGQSERLALEESQARTRHETADSYSANATAEARRLAGELDTRQREAAQLRTEQQHATRESETLREALTQARAEAASLERILNERSYSAEAVQRLFATNGGGDARGFRSVGVLADYAEVAEAHEPAIEQFLRDELEYVVVETFDHARAGISLLREEVGGRATFFVDSVRQLPRPAETEMLPFSAGDGVVARFDKLVSFRDPLGPAATHFLPNLANAYLVETAEAAERLSRVHTSHYFVTLEGTCYHGRLVSGGRPDEAGPLQIKRELRQLHARAADAEQGSQRTRARLDELVAALSAAEFLHTSAQSAHVEAEKTALSASIERSQAHSDLERAARMASECRIELARLEGEAGESRVRASIARRMLERAMAAAAATESEREQTVLHLETLRREQAAQQEATASQRAAAAQMAERVTSAETEATRLAAEAEEARGRVARLAERCATLEAELVALLASSGELEQRRVALDAEKSRLTAHREQCEQAFEAGRTRLAELDDLERRHRQAAADLREQRSGIEVARARNESDLGHLREVCANEMNLQPEEVMAMEPEPLSGEALEIAETELRDLRARLESMGAVNMMALEEFQQCEERHIFIDRERADLLAGIADTQQTIKELDEVSRERFEKAFEIINRNFAETFRTLFGGGTGQLRLTEPDSTGECGLEMVAQPPGKRLQNVLLLSGGEKALTALALLVAVFRYQPSPFCILDEVDAPLDESNVIRFTRLIAQMSEHTQFLIVTHNRRTMEIAEVLYGVTMQEPGVSKLVSVKWKQEAAEAPATEASSAQAASAAA
ncbi:MAG TPA: chromosome segregation protein SMC [Candidatus Acidoferrales bacterium]|nr:chromosome segregation protein SMC [Candidatus Acidoferrales bacterium]